jgi:hypothetical protein
MAAILVGAFALSGCGAADRLVDCHNICDRYKSCFQSDYDVGKCRSNCKDEADNNREFERKVDECAVCIDDRSCQSATFNCTTRCVGIVP